MGQALSCTCLGSRKRRLACEAPTDLPESRTLSALNYPSAAAGPISTEGARGSFCIGRRSFLGPSRVAGNCNYRQVGEGREPDETKS